MSTLIKILTLLSLPIFLSVSGQAVQPEEPDDPEEEEERFTSDFRIQDCNFTSTGTNPYFNLTPGRKLIYKGEEEGEQLDLAVSVLDETQEIVLPDVGTIETRVVEERESTDGRVTEVSRNFFAICDKTNDVYYFGEDVDIFEEDGTVTHEGAWRAGANGAQAGIIMPGTFLLGARYVQENAPGVALDRAKHTESNLTQNTPAGNFEKCVKVEETTPLELGEKSEKIYCPDVGLVVDDVLKLEEIQDLKK